MNKLGFQDLNLPKDDFPFPITELMVNVTILLLHAKFILVHSIHPNLLSDAFIDGVNCTCHYYYYYSHKRDPITLNIRSEQRKIFLPLLLFCSSCQHGQHCSKQFSVSHCRFPLCVHCIALLCSRLVVHLLSPTINSIDYLGISVLYCIH